MSIKGKVTYSYFCTICHFVYEDKDESRARDKAAVCEENKPKFVHTFQKGEILSHTFYAGDGDQLTCEVKVVGTFFEERSHVPMYMVKSQSLLGLNYKDGICHLSADRLQKVIPAQTITGQTKV